jgi:transposase
MTNKDIKPKDAFSLYFSKDKIEKGFRDMKQCGSMWPIYKRLTDHVIVDVFISHLVLLLMRVVEHLAQRKKSIKPGVVYRRKAQTSD